METKFKKLYQEVRPIVLKMRQSYQLRLWERDDWEQEGMIILYQLVCQKPEIVDSQLVFTYFKTKFSNHIKDQLRKQESQKRRLNKVAYDEIGEVGHRIPSREMMVAERIAYEEMLLHIEAQLTEHEKELMNRVMAGESFAGKAKFIRKLKQMMSDYDSI